MFGHPGAPDAAGGRILLEAVRSALSSQGSHRQRRPEKARSALARIRLALELDVNASKFSSGVPCYFLRLAVIFSGPLLQPATL